jgi:ubiquinone/menaquinone biosynthesis C-methylase UbiE
MERICEPELMEDPEQARAYAEADFSRSDRAMVEGLLERHGPRLGPRILDLGCGPGNITFLLADHCRAATVVGVDGSAAMLALAEARRQRQVRWGHSVRFLRECLPCPSLADQRFSAVVSNSLLHHLHDPQVLWRTLASLAAPGAVVLVQDLRRPVDEATCQRLVGEHGAGLPPLVRSDYLHSLRAAFTPQEVAAQLVQAGLEGLAVRPLGDQHLQVEGQLPGRLAP